MTIVGDILKFIENLAPRHMKMDWDNVGLLCGSSSAPVTKILLALDPFEHVCQEADQWGADLLVTHHPLIFRPVSSVTDLCDTTLSIMTLCRHGISHICAHTNLDCADGGVNDVLAQTLGLQNVEKLGAYGGMMRCGEVEEQSVDAFLAHVKEKLNCPGLRYCDGGKPVRKVAVGGGSCSDGLMDVIQAGCDTFVTADVKYNCFWDAQEQGVTLIDAGHFYTENPVCSVLADKIAAAFPEVTVVLSQKHADCMKFY